jgi:predicted DCC family thiol-disulfide oxidoreductase YuxK/uncharacterized membrane protein YphA (DoxX/SURF4 family)
VSRLARAWSGCWFRPAPLLNLAVVRIVVVAAQLAVLLVLDPPSDLAAAADYPGYLYDPIPVLHLIIVPVDWHWRPPYEVLLAAWWIALAAGVLSLAGLFTNASLVVFTVANVFMVAFRYSFVDYHHPEGVVMIALACLALAPCGRALALDDLRRRLRRNTRAGAFAPTGHVSERHAGARWPLLLMMCVLTIVYLSAGERKLVASGLEWMNGTTLQHYLIADGLRHGTIGVELGRFHLLARVLSVVTILFELTFGLVLVAPRLRPLYAAAGAAMHVGIYVAMRAHFFRFIAVYTVLFDWARGLERLRRRAARRPPVEVYYDGHCRLCIRSVTVLQYADLLDRVRFVDLETGGGRLLADHPDLTMDDLRRRLHVRRPDGRVEAGFVAIRGLAWSLPLLTPLLALLYVPPGGRLGPKVYDAIAARRDRRAPCDGTCAVHGSGDRAEGSGSQAGARK